MPPPSLLLATLLPVLQFDQQLLAMGRCTTTYVRTYVSMYVDDGSEQSGKNFFMEKTFPPIRISRGQMRQFPNLLTTTYATSTLPCHDVVVAAAAAANIAVGFAHSPTVAMFNAPILDSLDISSCHQQRLFLPLPEITQSGHTHYKSSANWTTQVQTCDFDGKLMK